MKLVTPYRQTLSHSCLIACFLMLLNSRYDINFSSKDEENLSLKGMSRKHPFFVVGMVKEIFKKYKKKINLVVNNRYFTNILIKLIKDKKNFNVHYRKIDIATIKALLKKNALICHIDNNHLGDYSHSSHFIVLEKDSGKRVTIIDPLAGKRRLISYKKLEESIKSLRGHVKMCPLLFYL